MQGKKNGFVFAFMMILTFSCGKSQRTSPNTGDPSDLRKGDSDQTKDSQNKVDLGSSNQCDSENPISTPNGCYLLCDDEKKFCLKSDEMPSQINRDKAVKACDNGKMLINDICENIKVDMPDLSTFVIRGSASGVEVLRRNKGDVAYKFLGDSRRSYGSPIEYFYPTNFPVAGLMRGVDLANLDIRPWSVGNARDTRNSGHHLSLELNVFGHGLKTDGASPESLKNHCQRIDEMAQSKDLKFNEEPVRFSIETRPYGEKYNEVSCIANNVAASLRFKCEVFGNSCWFLLLTQPL